ncbi:MAG TPA: HDIG domain-containing protein [Candidatus Omnitrophota bacterium]|nr:HDIG domain-containing protein [Candidatus Omnitrophota bacterium]
MFERTAYRIKQFWFAISSKMSETDRAFAYQHLNIKEAALFFSLPDFEQKHGVVVAQKMLAAAVGKREIDQRKLVRLGLLHDVGKSAARLTIFDKSILVIFHKLLWPVYDLFAGWGKKERSPMLFRKFYVHKHHGLIGSDILSKIAEEKDIVNEVRSHDYPRTSHDVYMRLLDEADSTY